MSFSQPVHNLDPRVCPKCGAVQESPGSTFCEQCGAMLSRLEVVPPSSRATASPRRPRVSLGLSGLARQPAILVRRLIGLAVRAVTLIARVVALALLLCAAVIGLGLVPEVRANVPQVKEAARTVLSWVQRAGQESVKLQASLNAPVRTTYRPVTAPSATTQALTVTSTPSGAAVLMDTRQVGKTPLTVKAARGVHKITVSRPGYTSITRTVTVTSAPISLNVNLPAAR